MRTWPTPRACTRSSAAWHRRAHAGRVRRRGAAARQPARREARHSAHHRAAGRRRRLGGRLPGGAGGLRDRALALYAARRLRCRGRQRADRGHAAGGRGPRRAAAGERPVLVQRSAFMRYAGQGHEITIALPDRPLVAADAATFRAGVRARVRPPVRPPHPQCRDRDHELGGAGDHGDGAARAGSRPLPRAPRRRPSASVACSTPGSAGASRCRCSSATAWRRRDAAGPRAHRRGRHLHLRLAQLRCRRRRRRRAGADRQVGRELSLLAARPDLNAAEPENRTHGNNALTTTHVEIVR